MARRQQPYIPLYVQDFMSDEKLNECSAESTGVYIRLMCVMHKSEEYGKILLKQKYKQNTEQNDGNCLQFARQLTKQMPYDIEIIERSLKELLEEGVITLDGDTIYQKRMVRDAELSDKRAVAGKKGGDQRKASEPKEEPAGEKKEPAEKDGLQERRFDEFWALYPKKVGKGAARKTWAKIKPDAELHQKILAAVQEAIGSEQWKKEHGQFIPNPATWLNQSRWEDELTKGEDDGRSRTSDWRDFKPSKGFSGG